MNQETEEQYNEQDNALVPKYTDRDVEEILRSVNQPKFQRKEQFEEISPDVLDMLIHKPEFEAGGILPDEIRKAAMMYDKTTALANTHREDFHHYKERMKDAKVVRMMSIREEDFTWEEEYLWTLLESWFDLELTRSEGGFERQMQVKQILQTYNEQMNRTPMQSGGGFLNRVRGMFGGNRGGN